MADVELVIKVPEDRYNRILNEGYRLEEDGKLIYKAIKNGTLRPKGHGVLKDTSEMEQIVCTLREKLIISGGMANLIRDVFLQAKPIIDADKESKE